MQTVVAKIIEEEELIKTMVDRFLIWNLPEDFSPDCGISFTPPTHNETAPIGTNLLTAEQAEQMVRYMLKMQEK